MTITIRLILVIVYILIDIIYVYFSKNVYDSVVIGIQGLSMPYDISRVISAVSAWTCMALGWYFLTTSLVEKWLSLGLNPYKVGLLAGLINGLVVIGTFNFTNYAMFTNYTVSLMIRDMSWGIGWVTIITIIYAVLYNKNK